MPVVRCAVCNKKQQVSSEGRVLIDPSLHVCSKECVFNWIDSATKEDFRNNIFRSMDSLRFRVLPDCYIDRGHAYRSGRIDHISFASNYELVFAEELRCKSIPFLYEWIGIFLHDECGKNPVEYIPDFFLPAHHCFIEIKGRWGIGSKRKIMLFRKNFPKVRILVVPWAIAHEFYKDLPDQGYLTDYE